MEKDKRDKLCDAGRRKLCGKAKYGIDSARGGEVEGLTQERASGRGLEGRPETNRHPPGQRSSWGYWGPVLFWQIGV